MFCVSYRYGMLMQKIQIPHTNIVHFYYLFPQNFYYLLLLHPLIVLIYQKCSYARHNFCFMPTSSGRLWLLFFLADLIISPEC